MVRARRRVETPLEFHSGDVDRNQEMIGRIKFCVIYSDENYLLPRQKTADGIYLPTDLKAAQKLLMVML